MSTVRISLLQAVLLVITTVTSTGHLLFVRIVAHYAGRDGWLSLLVALGLWGAGLLLTLRLLARHPGRSLVEISRARLGPIAGWIAGLVLVGYFALVNAVVLRSFADFMRLTMPQTPLIVMILVMLALAAGTSRLGVEALARANEVVLPLLIVTGMLVSIMVSKDKQARYLLPILEQGWEPVFAGALALTGLFAEAVVLGMLASAVQLPERSTGRAMWVVVVLGVMFLGPITGPTAVFGIANVRAMFYPTWEEVKIVQVAEFTAHLDVMGILLWTLGTFVKTSVLLWCTATGVASLGGVRAARPLVLPVAAITAALAMLLGGSTVEMLDFLTKTYPLLSIAVGIGLPTVLLAADKVLSHTRPDSGAFPPHSH